MKKSLILIFLLIIIALVTIYAFTRNNEISERKAEKITRKVLQELLEIGEEPAQIVLEYQNNQSVADVNSAKWQKDYYAYWKADCIFSSISDYRIWLDASEGNVVCIEQLPVNGAEGQNMTDSKTVENSEYELEDVISETKRFLTKAGYTVKDISSSDVSEHNSILLKNIGGDNAEYSIDYYQISFEYENGETGVIALCKDDLSLLKVWFRPYR